MAFIYFNFAVTEAKKCIAERKTISPYIIWYACKRRFLYTNTCVWNLPILYGANAPQNNITPHCGGMEEWRNGT